MKVYSKDGSLPAPLPQRIRLSNGLTRTNASTYTPEEIADAGYIEVIAPSYNGITHHLKWDGTSFVVTQNVVAQPAANWRDFRVTILQDPNYNLALQDTTLSIATALPAALATVERDGLESFADVYGAFVLSTSLITPSVRQSWADIAAAAHLPAAFVSLIMG